MTAPHSDPDPNVGRLLKDGKYRLVRRLDGGGMGDVYVARDEDLHRDVAVKLLRATVVSVEYRARFRREIDALVALSHPNIVVLYDGPSAADPDFYFVMELLDGVSLQQQLSSTPQLPVDQVIRVVGAIADALDAVHGNGRTHRDVKPGNIFLCRSGVIKLLDFGLARAPDDTPVTGEGQPGTQLYMSPECLEGSDATARSDQYALGVVAFEMVAGGSPFSGPNFNLMARFSATFAAIGSLRRDLPNATAVDDVMRTVLAVDPSVRFESCAAFAQALTRGLTGVAAAPRMQVVARAPTSSIATAAPSAVSIAITPVTSTPDPWQRYWVRRGVAVFPDRDGFLVDPDVGSLGVSMNPQAVPLAQLHQTPVLILLGEPGMGKSVELKREHDRAHAAAGADEIVHAMDLRDVITAEELRRRFASAPFTRLAANPTTKLVLFLDSLDEGMLEVRQLAALLVAELRNLDPRRTSLRIACRTADWPQLLEESLVSAFGEDQVQAHELLWLRQHDAFAAVSRAGIADADAFLREVRIGSLGALANRPLTLRFLIEVYRRDNHLPATRSELYREGCLQLMTEQNPARQAAGQVGHLQPTQRLVVAGRLAALSVLSNHPVFDTSVSASSLVTDDFLVRDAVGGYEADAEGPFRATEDRVREVLRTALFTATTSTTRLTWTHRSYAEFLAAWYLSVERISLADLLPLVIVTDSVGTTVVPGLAEVIGWLGTLRDDVRAWVLAHQPDMLLHGDPSRLSSDEKRTLVDTLLTRASGVELDDYAVRQRQFAGLEYSGLADQLRSEIENREAPHSRRLRAIEIARAAKVDVLAELLAEIALDESEIDEHRTDAAYAVRVFDDDAAKRKLLPLARYGAAGDAHAWNETNIELKGCALEALSPQLISNSDAFALIVASMAGHGSVYDYFLDHFADRLTDVDVLSGLAWLADQDEGQLQLEGFGTRALHTRILELAFANLTRPDVHAALAEVLARRASQHGSFIADASLDAIHGRLAADPDARRGLIAEMLPRLRQPRDAFEIVHGHPLTLFEREDLPWLLERVEQSEPASVDESRWLELLSWAFNLSDVSVIDRLCTLWWSRPSVRARFGEWFAPVELDSPAADREREILAQHEEHARRVREADAVPGPGRDRWLPLLESAERGEIDAWWRLNLEFLRDGSRGQHVVEFVTDLSARPQWEAASAEDRRRLLNVALWYVRTRDPGEAEWPDHRPSIWRPAIAGYRALVLLARHDSPMFAQLGAAVWARWAATVGGLLSNNSRDDSYAGILTQCWLHARAITREALLRVLRAEVTAHGEVFSLPALESVQDPQLADMLCEVLEQNARTYSATHRLLDNLLSRGHARAKAWAVAQAHTGDAGDERTLAAAMALIECDAPAHFHSIWSRAEHTPLLSETLLRQMARASLFVAQQDDAAIGTPQPLIADVVSLAMVVARAQPRSIDPIRPQLVAYSVTEQHEFARWRDALLSLLARSGAPEAFAALETLCSEFPADTELRYIMEQGRRTFRQSSWHPRPQSQLLQLFTPRDA
jgi:serine/threonine protein kinase